MRLFTEPSSQPGFYLYLFNIICLSVYWFILRQRLTLLLRVAEGSLCSPSWPLDFLQFSCLSFQSAGITGLNHHTQPKSCNISHLELEHKLVDSFFQSFHGF